MVVLDHDKARLADIRAAVRERLAADRLRLHPRKAHVTRVIDGLNLLGYKVYPNQRRLRNDNGHRFARRLRAMAKAYRTGRLDMGERRSLDSGLDRPCPNMQTRRGFAGQFSPRLCSQGERAKGRPACDPTRFLVQQTGEHA